MRITILPGRGEVHTDDSEIPDAETECVVARADGAVVLWFYDTEAEVLSEFPGVQDRVRTAQGHTLRGPHAGIFLAFARAVGPWLRHAATDGRYEFSTYRIDAPVITAALALQAYRGPVAGGCLAANLRTELAAFGVWVEEDARLAGAWMYQLLAGVLSKGSIAAMILDAPADAPVVSILIAAVAAGEVSLAIDSEDTAEELWHTSSELVGALLAKGSTVEFPREHDGHEMASLIAGDIPGTSSSRIPHWSALAPPSATAVLWAMLSHTYPDEVALRATASVAQCGPAPKMPISNTDFAPWRFAGVYGALDGACPYSAAFEALGPYFAVRLVMAALVAGIYCKVEWIEDGSFSRALGRLSRNEQSWVERESVFVLRALVGPDGQHVTYRVLVHALVALRPFMVLHDRALLPGVGTATAQALTVCRVLGDTLASPRTDRFADHTMWAGLKMRATRDALACVVATGLPVSRKRPRDDDAPVLAPKRQRVTADPVNGEPWRRRGGCVTP